jgi:hypothetical protein
MLVIVNKNMWLFLMFLERDVSKNILDIRKNGLPFGHANFFQIIAIFR